MTYDNAFTYKNGLIDQYNDGAYYCDVNDILQCNEDFQILVML